MAQPFFVNVSHIVDYFAMVRGSMRTLLAPREPLIQGMYYQRMGVAHPIGETSAATRECYRAFLREQSGSAPDDVLLELLERRYVNYLRLQAAWMLFWIVLLPAILLLYTLIRGITSPVQLSPLHLVLVLLMLILFAMVLVVLGFIMQSILARPFRYLCARVFSIPGLLELPA